MRKSLHLRDLTCFSILFAWVYAAHIHRSGGRPYPEVTVAVLPSSLAKVLS